MGNRLQALNGKHSVPLDDLFPPEFMRQYTNFGSLDEMFKASGFKVETEEDFGNIPDDEWDEFVAQHTRFDNWEEMMGSGAEAWATKQLGF